MAAETKANWQTASLGQVNNFWRGHDNKDNNNKDKTKRLAY